MVDFLGGVPIKWKLFFQKFGLAGSPVTEPSSGNKDDPFNVSCSVSLFCLFLFCFCLAGRYFFFFNENKSHWQGLCKHGLNQKDLPLD